MSPRPARPNLPLLRSARKIRQLEQQLADYEDLVSAIRRVALSVEVHDSAARLEIIQLVGLAP